MLRNGGSRPDEQFSLSHHSRDLRDYADSHKNKTWQPFAAAAAAACAKEILSFVPPAAHSRRPGVEDARYTAENNTEISQSNGPGNFKCGQFGTAQNQAVEAALKAEQRQSYLESLKFGQIDARHATIKTAHAKTCRWLIDKCEYQEWLDTDKFSKHHGFLWIKGKPGTGKSTIMKFVYAHAKKEMRDATVISFFFNARGEELEKSTLGMYRSLLFQLLKKLPDLQDVFDLLQPTAPDSGRWDIETIKGLFEHAIRKLGRRCLTCFIDALDECEEDEVRDMLSFFEQIGQRAVSSQCQFYICFSSRHYPHITIENGIQLVLENQEGHQRDITNYLHSELKAGRKAA